METALEVLKQTVKQFKHTTQHAHCDEKCQYLLDEVNW